MRNADDGLSSVDVNKSPSTVICDSFGVACLQRLTRRIAQWQSWRTKLCQ